VTPPTRWTAVAIALGVAGGLVLHDLLARFLGL
jgi:hypothetical protein